MNLRTTLVIIAIAIVVAVIASYALNALTVYEDGSWIWRVSGCMPWAICR